MNTQNKLKSFFEPQSIALIGASEKPSSLGLAVLSNMKEAGFAGHLYPVNPKYTELGGLTCYKRVGDIKGEVELAVILTPAATVVDLVKDCAKKGCHALLILSAGFKEAGEKGQSALNQILEIARLNDMRIIGPNCLGIMNPRMGINATFAARGAQTGRIAFLSQSGAVCANILDWAVEQEVGFSYMVSVGSMADVGFHDLIEYMNNDPNTSSILIYMETLSQARKFMSAARAFSRNKPIIVLKAGASEQGAQAALSHTGSLAGNDKVFDAAFRRAGILRVNRIADLFHCAQAIAMQPQPKGNKLAIVTNAGGPGVLATDRLELHGGKLAKLSEHTLNTLNQGLSTYWSHSNPVDILGDGSALQFGNALQICAKDPEVDAILVIYVPQAISPARDVAKVIVEVSKHISKPVYAAWLGEADVVEARDLLEQGRIPNYRYPESAIDVFLLMNQYRQNLKSLFETPDREPHSFHPDRKAARTLIDHALSEGKTNLERPIIAGILAAYDIPISAIEIATTTAEAVQAAERIGFPIAMKIYSPDISHKTDVGGVVLDIRNEEEVVYHFNDVTSRAATMKPEAKIIGVTLEAMIHKRHELIIGAKKDPTFGPVIVFGMGGVAVEVFKDLQMELPPLNMALAKRMVKGTKISTLLKGYRKMPRVDMDALYFLLVRFGYLLMDFPEIVECDLNPYVLDEEGGVVIDARMMIKPMSSPQVLPCDHLVISPYPSQFIRESKLSDGTPVILRPIRPEDEPLEADLLSRLSKETVYFRFFGFAPHGDHDFLSRFTHIDYDREMAIVAEINLNDQPTLIGVVRIVGDHEKHAAEFAIVVADDWHRKGLGNQLTDYIIEIAAVLGYRALFASFMKSNHGMYHLFLKKGFAISEEDGNTNKAILKLNK